MRTSWKSKKPCDENTFRQSPNAYTTNRRRTMIPLRERVEEEFKNLAGHFHIINIDESSDKQSISHILVTVKKDQTFKMELKENLMK